MATALALLKEIFGYPAFRGAQAGIIDHLVAGERGLTPQQVREELKSVDAIIIRSGTTLTAELLEGQDRLKCIARAGVGVDNINLEAATRAGVLVMNTPSGNTISTAEHTFAMMLALSRNIGPAHASMKAGKWDRKSFQGTQLAGKTLAVLGLGRIGLSVAARARAIVYDDGLPEPCGQSLRHFADDQIPAAASCERNNEANRSHRVILRERAAGDDRECGKREFNRRTHALPSPLCASARAPHARTQIGRAHV